jgi:methionyl-tRNA synthetase
MYEGEMCEECGGEMKEGEMCECGNKGYTMEELEENVKLKSKSNMVMEDIDKSLDWFKKLIK